MLVEVRDYVLEVLRAFLPILNLAVGLSLGIGVTSFLVIRFRVSGIVTRMMQLEIDENVGSEYILLADELYILDRGRYVEMFGSYGSNMLNNYYRDLEQNRGKI